MRTDINAFIVADSEICHGQPTFKGTRIMVYIVIEMLQAGYTVKDILKAYPSLTKDHIMAALDFAAKLTARERIRAIA